MTTTLDATYQRLRAELGKETTQRLGAISRRDLERFAAASGATVDEDDRPAAHPLFLSSVMGWGAGAAEHELGADGTSAEETRGLPLGGVRLMGAGQSVEFHAPVLEEMYVVVHTSLAEVSLKDGRSGPLLLLQVLRRFADDTGRRLITCRESFIGR